MKPISHLKVYKRRYPKSTSLWQLLNQHFIEFLECYDEQFQSRYGFYLRAVKLSTAAGSSTLKVNDSVT